MLAVAQAGKRRTIRNRRSYRMLWVMQLWRKSQMSNGLMWQDWSRQSQVCRRQWSCQRGSPSCLLVRGSLGREFCCTDLLVRERVTWRRLVRLKQMGHSSPLVLQIWSASGWESQKDSWNSCSKWLGRADRQLSSLMRLTPYAVPEAKEKTKPPGE